jgi:uncharacterized membrane protein
MHKVLVLNILLVLVLFEKVMFPLTFLTFFLCFIFGSIWLFTVGGLNWYSYSAYKIDKPIEI